jgi:hypothetical protein
MSATSAPTTISEQNMCFYYIESGNTYHAPIIRDERIGQIDPRMIFCAKAKGPLNGKAILKPGEDKIRDNGPVNLMIPITSSQDHNGDATMRQLFTCICTVIQARTSSDVIVVSTKQPAYLDELSRDVSEQQGYTLAILDEMTMTTPDLETIQFCGTTFCQWFVSLMINGYEDGSYPLLSDQVVYTTLSGNLFWGIDKDETFLVSHPLPFRRQLHFQSDSEPVRSNVLVGPTIVPIPRLDEYSDGTDVHVDRSFHNRSRILTATHANEWYPKKKNGDAGSAETYDGAICQRYVMKPGLPVSVERFIPSPEDRYILGLSVSTLARSIYAKHSRWIEFMVMTGEDEPFTNHLNVSVPFFIERNFLGSKIIEYPASVNPDDPKDPLACETCYADLGRVSLVKPGRACRVRGCGCRHLIRLKTKTHTMTFVGYVPEYGQSTMVVKTKYYQSELFVIGGGEKFPMSDAYISVHKDGNITPVPGSDIIMRFMSDFICETADGSEFDMNSTHVSPFPRYIWEVIRLYIVHVSDADERSNTLAVTIRNIDGSSEYGRLEALKFAQCSAGFWVMLSRMAMFESIKASDSLQRALEVH